MIISPTFNTTRTQLGPTLLLGDGTQEGEMANHALMNGEEFLTAFEACMIEEFHHRDHIKVAYLYLQRHPP